MRSCSGYPGISAAGDAKQVGRIFLKKSALRPLQTERKGTILVECGKMLQRGTPKLGKDGKPMKDKRGKVIYEPYRIKVLNTINFKKSMHYNPFAYIHSEKDILKLVTTLNLPPPLPVCRSRHRKKFSAITSCASRSE